MSHPVERVVCRKCGWRGRRAYLGADACDCVDPCSCPRYAPCPCGWRVVRSERGRGRPRKLADDKVLARWPEVVAGTISRRRLAVELSVTVPTLMAAAERLGLVVRSDP